MLPRAEAQRVLQSVLAMMLQRISIMNAPGIL